MPAGIAAEVVAGFLAALRAEYVRRAGPEVGRFFRRGGKRHASQLEPLERCVRDASDPSAAIEVVPKYVKIAMLAEIFSSFSTGTQYSAELSELWVKPDFLRAWLRVAKERQYEHARIVMHGTKDEAVLDKMKKDPIGHNMFFSALDCQRGPGVYLSTSDHLALEYRKGDLHNNRVDTWAVEIGLLLCDTQVVERTAEAVNSPQRLGASLRFAQLEFFNRSPVCNSQRGEHLERFDAIVLRDLSLYLPLGKAAIAQSPI